MAHKLSIVVPVYNEAQTIQQVLDRVDEIDLGGIDKEVIVVDDGSTDGSATIIAERMRREATSGSRTCRLSIWARARRSASVSNTRPATS